MPLPPVRRRAMATTPGEYFIYKRVHEHLQGSGPLYTERRKLNSRKRLALLCGISEKVAQEAIRLYNAGEIPVASVVGRPKSQIDPEVAQQVREIILASNMGGTPMNSALLVVELAKLGTVVTTRTLQRQLKALGYHYGRGNRRNILHDSEANIDYRNVYLEKRLANLNANGLPKLPEVFLDESYCHLDHHARFTWVPAKGVVNERGRKPMLVIFGAFVVFRQDNKLEARMVRESVLIWPVKGKLRGARGRGRAAAEDELWRTVPAFVRESAVAPDFHDYHGNFTAELFERLFERLCDTLAADYGPCHIHMDGARYHVRKVDPEPTSSSRVAHFHEWLQRKGIVAPPAPNGGPMSKMQLLTYVKSLRIPATHASYSIAQERGHRIMKTPPYHCELQPIEKVWALVKNQVAAAPRLDETELSLRNRLLELFARVTPAQLKGLWKGSVKICKDYWTVFEQELEEGVDTDDESSSSEESRPDDHDDDESTDTDGEDHGDNSNELMARC